MVGTWSATADAVSITVLLQGTGVMGGPGGRPVHFLSPTGDGIRSLHLTGQRLLLGLTVFLVPKPIHMRQQSARDPRPQLGGWNPLGTGSQMSGEKQQDDSWDCLSGGFIR